MIPPRSYTPHTVGALVVLFILVALGVTLCVRPTPRTTPVTYYLGASGASDSNACTAAAPCATFAHVMPQARPGDTIVLKGGTYTQPLRLGIHFSVTDGTAEQPILVQGAPGDTAVLKPSGPEALGVGAGTRYWHLQDLTVDGSNLSGGGTYGVSVHHGGAYGTTNATQHIVLRRIAVTNMRNLQGGNSMGFQVFADDVTLEDCTCDGTSGAVVGDGQGSHCFYGAGPGNHGKILGGAYHHAGGFGIQLNDSGHAGGSDGNTGWLIRGVRIFRNGRRGSGGGGLTLYHNQRASRVEATLIYANAGPGVLVEGGNNQDNVFVNTTIVGSTSQCVTGGSDSGHATTRLSLINTLCADNYEGVRLRQYATQSTLTSTLCWPQADCVQVEDTGSTVTGTVLADPRFIDAAHADYHLASGSPAIGAGGTGAAVDVEGTRYPAPPDIGAYSSGAAPEPTPPPGPVAMQCTGRIAQVPGDLQLACTPQTRR